MALPLPRPFATSQIRPWLAAADRYFLSDALRSRTANELAYARIGIIGCFATGLATLAFVALLCFRMPSVLVATVAVVGLSSLALPFKARQSNAVFRLGHYVCAQIALIEILILACSGGRATGFLPVVPLIPMLALLTLGGRAAIGWSVAAVGILAFGFGLAVTETPPPFGEFHEFSPARRYPLALICLATMAAVSFLFERLWERSARELAERARADVARSEERQRALLEHASEGILVLDRDGIVQFASTPAERLIGAPPGSIMGRRLSTLTDEAGRLEAIPLWKRAMDQPGQQIRAELRSYRRSPDASDEVEPIQIEITITNQLDHPAVRGVVVHVHDATDLSRAKANYQNLVEESIQGIAVVSHRRVVYANQALCALFGRPLERFVGLTIEQTIHFVHPEDRAEVVATLSRPFGANSNGLEMRIQREDDQAWRWMQLRWADAMWEGRPARQIIYADVTAQKELEASRLLAQERLEERIAERTRELEASQQTLRAQERLAAVGTLAAGVAHQINNPVGAMLAAADFALATSDDPDRAETARSALQEIRHQAVRCGKIIRSILQFSRSERTEKWSADVVSVLRTAVDVTRRFAHDRRATVSLELEAGVSISNVLMSPIELEQVFVNLILNAIQAQSEGAEVWVSARQLAHEIEIRVEDDGPGIPACDRDRVFDPFFTTRLKGGGTGLGLSVAHGIIEDHGGRMTLVDDGFHPAASTCFLVHLPLEKPDHGVPARG